MASTPKNPEQQTLRIKAVTWLKDSHSLFDYEFNKNIIQQMFDFTLQNKFVFIYRNNKTSRIFMHETQGMSEPQNMVSNQLMGCFEVKASNKKTKIEFYHAASLANMLRNPEQNTVKTEGSIKQNQKKQQDIYLIVRSLKNKNNENKGYKLEIGQVVKLGRVQYKVSAIKKSQASTVQAVASASGLFLNNQVAQCDQVIENIRRQQGIQCKYCLREQEQQDNFFVSPCNCIGSAGVVHFKCLEQWIQSKVKKQVNGGTKHYNFEKFFCELCKKDFPRFINRKAKTYQLMPIQKPQGSFLILQGVSQKSNSMIVLQNIPKNGIKIGRSHQCQIRVTDISVSRNHATIQRIDQEFLIFDCKSKFGTLVKQQRLTLEMGNVKQGIQIGRSVFTFQINRK